MSPAFQGKALLFPATGYEQLPLDLHRAGVSLELAQALGRSREEVWVQELFSLQHRGAAKGGCPTIILVRGPGPLDTLPLLPFPSCPSPPRHKSLRTHSSRETTTRLDDLVQPAPPRSHHYGEIRGRTGSAGSAELQETSSV